MPLSAEELAYAAGIIDGEGCIRVNKQGASGRHIAIRLHVTNTDPRLCSWLKDKFGGYIWTESRSYLPNAKIRFVWEVSAKKAAVVLVQIMPYLFLKKDRAEIALAIQATKTKGRTTVTVETQNTRIRLIEELRVLNKKGAA